MPVNKDKKISELDTIILSIQEIPDFSELLNQSASLDDETSLFTEKLKQDFQGIKDIIQTIPVKFIPTEEKDRLVSTLFSKLPKVETFILTEATSNLVEAASSASQAFKNFFTFNNDEEDNKLLEDACKRLTEIINEKSWASFRDYVPLRQCEDITIGQLNANRQEIISELSEKITELDDLLEKLQDFPEVDPDLLKTGHSQLAKLKSRRDDIAAEFCPSDDRELRQTLSLNEKVNHLKARAVQLDLSLTNLEKQKAIPLDLDMQAYRECYSNNVTSILTPFVNNVYRNNRISIKSKIEFKELKTKQPMEVLELIKEHCHPLDQKILTAFFQGIKNNNNSLTALKTYVDKYLPKLNKLWEVRKKTMVLKNTIGLEKFKNNPVFKAYYTEYTKEFEPRREKKQQAAPFDLDPDNIKAEQFINVLDKLIEFYPIQRNIQLISAFFEKRGTPLKLSEETNNILENFEQDLLNRKNSSKEPETVKLQKFKTDYVEFLNMFKGICKQGLENIQKNTVESDQFKDAFNESNQYHQRYQDSKSKISAMYENLNKHFQTLENPPENFDLTDWHTTFKQQTNDIKEEFTGEFQRAHDLCNNDTILKKSKQVIESINREIDRLCSKYIQSVRVTNIIDKSELDLLKNRNEKSFHEMNKDVSLEIYALIDPRLQNLFKLRGKISQKNFLFIRERIDKTEYLENLFKIAKEELEPQNLMLYSDPVRNSFSQFIRRILYALKSLRHCLCCSRSPNQLRFFGTALGASNTENAIADQMVYMVNGADREEEKSTNATP